MDKVSRNYVESKSI